MRAIAWGGSGSTLNRIRPVYVADNDTRAGNGSSVCGALAAGYLTEPFVHYLRAVHFPLPPDDDTNVTMHAGVFWLVSVQCGLVTLFSPSSLGVYQSSKRINLVVLMRALNLSALKIARKF